MVFYSPAPQHTSPSYFRRSLCEPSPVPSNENKLPNLHEHYHTERRGEKEKAGRGDENHLPNKLPGLDFKIKDFFFNQVTGGGEGIFSTPQNDASLAFPSH